MSTNSTARGTSGQGKKAGKSKASNALPKVKKVPVKIGKGSPPQKYRTAKECFEGIHSRGGPTYGYVDLGIPGPSQAMVLEGHTNSMKHCLKPGFSGAVPGSTGPIKNCTRLATEFLLRVVDKLPGDGSKVTHINRGWTMNTRRYFQGAVSTDGILPSTLEGPFRGLTNDEIPPTAAVIELPTVNPGDNAILFMYAGATDEQGIPTGHSLPHGIARNGTTTARDWHTEPGGAIFICVTENTATSSSGLYLTPPDTKTMDSVFTNQAKRKSEEARGKYIGIHDNRLVSNDLSIDTNNFICAQANAVPVTWAGNHVSDPLSMKGNGRIHNQHKVTGPFTLREGLITAQDLLDAPWPVGIKPPQELYDWAVQHDFKFCNLFLHEAYTFPENFVILFPTFATHFQ